MPADLLESELFGYEQGAFTGAVKSKPGKFEICDKGTILLDEIAEMPPALQAKLLQVLQDGSFARLGSRASVKVDVRVIAATNIDIKEAIARKTFREDLYYRLNGFTLEMPPLRERIEEVPILCRHFMRKVAAKYECDPLPISPALMQALTSHTWPGNLRELENTIKRYLVLADEQAIMNELIPWRRAGSLASATERPGDRQESEASGAKPEGRCGSCRDRTVVGGLGLEPQGGGKRSANQLQGPVVQDQTVQSHSTAKTVRSQSDTKSLTRFAGAGNSSKVIDPCCNLAVGLSRASSVIIAPEQSQSVALHEEASRSHPLHSLAMELLILST